jgi:hypothetical protein
MRPLLGQMSSAQQLDYMAASSSLLPLSLYTKLMGESPNQTIAILMSKYKTAPHFFWACMRLLTDSASETRAMLRETLQNNGFCKMAKLAVLFDMYFAREDFEGLNERTLLEMLKMSLQRRQVALFVACHQHPGYTPRHAVELLNFLQRCQYSF